MHFFVIFASFRHGGQVCEDYLCPNRSIAIGLSFV
jgi:hypothetical protein